MIWFKRISQYMMCVSIHDGDYGSRAEGEGQRSIMRMWVCERVSIHDAICIRFNKWSVSSCVDFFVQCMMCVSIHDVHYTVQHMSSCVELFVQYMMCVTMNDGDYTVQDCWSVGFRCASSDLVISAIGHLNIYTHSDSLTHPSMHMHIDSPCHEHTYI